MNPINAARSLLVATLLFLIPTVALGQSESEVVVGDWNCAVEGNSNPTFFQLLDNDTAQMCNTKDGKLLKNWTKGKWEFDDVDFDEDDQAVVTIKVTWDGHNEHATKTEMTVKLTLIDEDKLQVRWQNEPMRIWSRVKADEYNQSDQ